MWTLARGVVPLLLRLKEAELRPLLVCVALHLPFWTYARL